MNVVLVSDTSQISSANITSRGPPTLQNGFLLTVITPCMRNYPRQGHTPPPGAVLNCFPRRLQPIVTLFYQALAATPAARTSVSQKHLASMRNSNTQANPVQWCASLTPCLYRGIAQPTASPSHRLPFKPLTPATAVPIRSIQTKRLSPVFPMTA